MRLDVSTTLRSAQHDGIKDLYRDKVSNRHPETSLLDLLTKDLAVRRTNRYQNKSFPHIGANSPIELGEMSAFWLTERARPPRRRSGAYAPIEGKKRPIGRIIIFNLVCVLHVLTEQGCANY